MAVGSVIIFTSIFILIGEEDFRSSTEPLWEFDTGGPVRSAAAVTGGMIVVGSDSGYLFAVEKKAGEEKWRFEADSSVSSDLCLDGNTVFFTTKKGSLYSIDIQTAALNWRFSSKAERLYEGGWDYFVSSPVMAGENVVFGSGDNNIRALSKESGEEIWAFDTGAIMRSTPAARNDTVYCGTM